MKLIYGTTNAGKLAAMKRSLASLAGVEIVGLKEMEAALNQAGKTLPEVQETGTTNLENARLKAMAYYDVLKMPVFSCDSCLYFDGLPEERQPGVHVRNIRGKCLTDEEMTVYYADLAKTYGDITARYKNAICFVLDEDHVYESVDDSLSGEPFLLTSVPHPRSQEGFPLDRLSKDLATGAYFYDMDGCRQDVVAVNTGFLDFFKGIFS